MKLPKIIDYYIGSLALNYIEEQILESDNLKRFDINKVNDDKR